ncbi:hypothetical protein SLE2022_322990 [Rubroshorea leprosula]
MGATGICTWKYNVGQSGIQHVLNPDPYRGDFGSDAKRYAKDVGQLIQYGTSARIAGFFAEPIQGTGGILELVPGYLPTIYDIVRKPGDLSVADELQSGYAHIGIIGDVRGRGLMLRLGLVTDRKLKTPAQEETVHIMDQMKELGVLIGKGGYFGNVFRTPSLCFTKDDADFLVDAMDYTMSKM